MMPRMLYYRLLPAHAGETYAIQASEPLTVEHEHKRMRGTAQRRPPARTSTITFGTGKVLRKALNTKRALLDSPPNYI